MDDPRRFVVIGLLLLTARLAHAQDATIGIGIRGASGSAGITVSAGQGSQRSIASQSAMLTASNGGYGYIASGTWQPFVTSFVPVVGSYYPQEMYIPPTFGYVPMVPATTGNRFNDQQLRERRREAGVRRLVQQAEGFAKIGRIPDARMHYRMAIRRTSGEMRLELEKKLQQLSD